MRTGSEWYHRFFTGAYSRVLATQFDGGHSLYQATVVKKLHSRRMAVVGAKPK